jgi:hypothetical protein
VVQSTHRLVIGDDEVVKTYVDWGRGEPVREWRALTLLHRHAPGLSPRPIRRGTDGGNPFIVMSRLPGRPLGEQPLTSAQVGMLGAAMRRMYRSLPLDALVDQPVRNWGAADMLARVKAWIAEPRGHLGSLVDGALAMASDWLHGPEASVVAECDVERIFALADGNLGNVLWDGSRCYLVDFEDAGWSDVAYEVADLVEHVSVWLDGSMTAEALTPYLMLTADETRRLVPCRRLFAVFWLLMLLPGNPAHARTSAGTGERQAARVVALMGSGPQC